MAIPERFAHYQIIKEAAGCKNREETSAWLWRALQDYYDPRRKNPSNLGILLGNDFYPTEGLDIVYFRALETESQKLAFRQAIGDTILNEGVRKETPLELLRDLVYCAGSVRAVESVHSFHLLLVSQTGERRASLLDAVMSNLLSLVPAPEVQEVTEKIVDASYFDNGYIFGVINILAECDPTNSTKTIELLQTFRPHITKLREEVKKLGGEEWQAYVDAADELILNLSGTNSANQEILRKELLPA